MKRARISDCSQERRARIEQMIDEYREAKKRRFLQRAMTLWRQAEFRQQLVVLDAQPERVH